MNRQKIMTGKLFLLAVGLHIYACCAAQDKRVGSKDIVIAGRIQGGKVDSIQIYSWGDAKNLYVLNQSPAITFLKTDAAGRFHIVLPAPKNRLGSFAVNLLRGEEIRNRILTEISEPGDSLFIDIDWSKKTVAIDFSGRNIEKYSVGYQLKMEMDSCIQHTDSLAEQEYYTIDNIPATVDSLKRLSNLLLDRLAASREKIDPEIFAIMKVNIQSQFDRQIISIINTVYSQAGSRDKKELVKLYDRVHGELAYDNEYAAYSSSAIVSIEMYYQMASLYHYRPDKLSIDGYYAYYRDHFSGLFRERLMIALLNRANGDQIADRPGIKDSLWKETLLSVKDPVIREYIQNKLRNGAKDSPAFDFLLYDARGRAVRLGDFKGKVVLVDFWFTGCGGCRMYSEVLERKIYPVFDGRADVVFLSVSGDRNREQWLKSVKEGGYTRKANVNVYTGGQGFEHPFTKFYYFNGGPHSLLIDKKGKIFSVDPPKADTGLLISMIYEALQQ